MKITMSLVVLTLCLGLASTSWADGPVVSPASGNGIEWNPVVATDLKEYRVFQKSLASQSYTYTTPFVVVQAPGVGHSFSGTIRPPEGQNYMVVRTVDLAGNQSVDSNQVAFVFDATIPDAPVIRLLIAESEYEWESVRVMTWEDFVGSVVG